MIAVRTRINVHALGFTPVIPIAVPDLDEVREFACQLHAKGQYWQGQAFGWEAEYNPERAQPPLDSKMRFTPADFSIGESGIWFFSLMWEHGRDQAPVEFMDDLASFAVLRKKLGQASPAEIQHLWDTLEDAEPENLVTEAVQPSSRLRRDDAPGDKSLGSGKKK